jgi:hypothetical protein
MLNVLIEKLEGKKITWKKCVKLRIILKQIK